MQFPHTHVVVLHTPIQLLLLEFVLAVELVRAVFDEGLEMRDVLKEDVAELIDDGTLFLSLCECVSEGEREDLGIDV